MRRTAVLFAAGTLLLAACADRPPTAPEERAAPAFDNTASSSSCISTDSIETLIRVLFPAGQDRRAALSRFRQIVRLVGPTNPGPDTASAQNHALQLVDFSLKKYFAGQLLGGQTTAVAQNLATLLTGILCTVGLPPFNPAALGLDGAAVVVSPTSPPTTIVTGTDWAGVHVNTGDVPQTTLITITRLPDFPGPLLTPFDQYPIYYQFEYNPGITFTEPVLVGTCLANSAAPPDLSRLRLAHNVAPFTWGSIEVLPFVNAPFLDCTDADIGVVPTRWGLDGLARGGARLLGKALATLVVPQPLYAAVFGGSGVGGTVRNFSPFGIVDTLGVMTAAATSEHLMWHVGAAVDVPPAVYLNTPTGQPMLGVPVTFAVTAGGGTVGTTATASDASGFATSGSWVIGVLPGLNTVTATATGPAGTGFAGSPLVFSITGVKP